MKNQSNEKSYWMNVLSDIEEYIKYYKIDSNEFDCENLSLSDETFFKIEEFIESQDISYFKFFISIFSLYLSRIDGTRGCILKTFSSSVTDELYTILKIDYNKMETFEDYVNHVSHIYDDALAHASSDIGNHVENSNDLLFYSINDFDNAPYENSVLTLNFYQSDLKLIYNASLFSKVYVRHMLENLLAMINDVIDSPLKSCKDIDILSDMEKDLLKDYSKGNVIEFDEDYTLAKAFRDNALKTPDKIAVNDGVNKITFGELEKSSNSIAYALQNNHDIKDGMPVCLMLARNYHFPEFVLALNKIGAYVIPIDSRYPKNRIEHMINLSQSKHIIIDNNFEGLDTFDMDIIRQDELNRDFEEDVEIKSKGNDLFSILFTSGTTGLPKGVMLTNNQVNNWNTLLHSIPLSCDEVIGIYRDFPFVGSYWIYVALSMGMTCRVFNETEQKELSCLVDEFKKGNVDLVDLPDSLAMEIFANNNDVEMKYLITGGSKVSKIPVSGNTNVFIIYGTTEINMSCMHHLNESDDNVPIGRPVANRWIYILDDNCNRLPIGVPGEICVSSEYISPGYFNSPDLTDKAFIDNPFSDCDKNRRMYRTGDVGFYNFDGNIEILGRMDDQLSVRGFRVESGEIINIMKGFDGISEVILNVIDDILIAYYMADKAVDLGEVKNALEEELPFYMIPSIFIKIDEIPLNVNGKIDKSKLPKRAISVENVPPKNDTERELLKLCHEILNNDDFGVTDNLLSLGFSSLSFMNLNYKIRSKLDVNLKVVDLMECSNVCEISEILDNNNEQIFKKYDKMELYPLTNNQTIVYENRASFPEAFKMYYTVKIRNVDVFKLKDSFIKAVNRHPFLKASFVTEDGTFYIKRDDDADTSNLVNIYRLDKQGFDLFEKYLFELDTDFYDKYFDEAFSKYCNNFFYCVMVENENNVIVRLLFDHLAFDQYSISLLFKEIDKIYYDMEDEIEEEIVDGFDYNMFIVNDERESIELFDKIRNETMNYGDLFIPTIYEYEKNCCETDEVTYRVDKKSAQEFCNKNNIPYYQLFMTSFVLAIHRYAGLNMGILSIVSNGRFFNELMNTQHYIAKTIYLKFKINKDLCLNDVFNNISDEMKRIIKTEPNSIIFTYDNQWLFNFIETNKDLNFDISELNQDKNKPKLIKNTGRNILNDVFILEMEEFYSISIKYHNKRYDEEYIYSFLKYWDDIVKHIISKNDLNESLDFVEDI